MIETKKCCVKARSNIEISEGKRFKSRLTLCASLAKSALLYWWVGLICCILTNRAKWGPNSTQADELMMIVMKPRHDFPRVDSKLFIRSVLYTKYINHKQRGPFCHPKTSHRKL